MPVAPADQLWHLQPGERIRWEARPHRSTATRAAAIPGLFGAVWVAVVAPMPFRSLATGDTSSLIVGSVFLVVGFSMLLAPLFAFFAASRTRYAITDRRLLIARRNGSTINSISLSAASQVTRLVGRAGRTTLRIPIRVVPDGEGGQQIDYAVLHGVRDGDRAYQLLTHPGQL